jgi:hypothetical protein
MRKALEATDTGGIWVQLKAGDGICDRLVNIFGLLGR